VMQRILANILRQTYVMQLCSNLEKMQKTKFLTHHQIRDEGSNGFHSAHCLQSLGDLGLPVCFFLSFFRLFLHATQQCQHLLTHRGSIIYITWQIVSCNKELDFPLYREVSFIWRVVSHKFYRLYRHELLDTVIYHTQPHPCTCM
jgi:hypothetical protein